MFSEKYNLDLNVALAFYILAALFTSFAIVLGLATWYRMNIARIVLPLTAVSVMYSAAFQPFRDTPTSQTLELSGN